VPEPAAIPDDSSPAAADGAQEMTELEAWATVRPLAWNESSRAVLHDALARDTP
jgi:hypothetical protein